MLPKQIIDLIVLVGIITAIVGFFVCIGLDQVNRTNRRIFYADKYGNVDTTLRLYTLSPYIARKIFDLAVLQNEHCAITHEAFHIGDVAIMPCGHLYCKSALHRYFLTVNDKICLICKLPGAPVYL
jgi:hypothetical protein